MSPPAGVVVILTVPLAASIVQLPSISVGLFKTVGGTGELITGAGGEVVSISKINIGEAVLLFPLLSSAMAVASYTHSARVVPV